MQSKTPRKHHFTTPGLLRELASDADSPSNAQDAAPENRGCADSCINFFLNRDPATDAETEHLCTSTDSEDEDDETAFGPKCPGEPQPLSLICFGDKGRKEASRIFNLARPLLFSYLAQNASQTVAVAFVGHYGTEELAAMNLANVIIYGSLVFVTGSVCGACHSLCSQAHAAAQDSLETAQEGLGLISYQEDAQRSFRSIGVWLQVALVWPSIIMLPPLILLWIYTGEILEQLGACQEELCDMAAFYAQVSLTWLVPYTVFNVVAVYLESLEIFLPQTMLSVFFIVVNIPLNFLFIFGFTTDPGQHTGLGFVGSPLAAAFSHILQLLALVLYIWGRKIKLKSVQDTWHGWSYECLELRRAWIFFSTGLPLGSTEVFHDWIFQIAILVAGSFGSLEVAAVGVLMNLLVLLTPCLFSYSHASSIRLKIRLEKRMPQHAYQSYLVGFGVTMAIAFSVAALVMVCRTLIAGIYSDDKSVDLTIQRMAPMAALYFFAQAVGFVHGGTLEEIGKSWVTHAATFFSNWLFGMSLLACLVGADHDGPVAIWSSLALGEVVKGIILVSYVQLGVDWEMEGYEAVKRAEAQEEEYRLMEIDTIPEKQPLNGATNRSYGATEMALSRPPSTDSSSNGSPRKPWWSNLSTARSALIQAVRPGSAEEASSIL